MQIFRIFDIGKKSATLAHGIRSISATEAARELNFLMRSSYQNTDLASKTILFSKRMMKFVLLLAFLALAVAFNTAPTRSGRMAPSMLFGGGKKKAAASAPTGKGKKSTSPGAVS